MNHQSQAELLSALVAIFPDFQAEWELDIAGDEIPNTSLHSVYMSFLPFVARANATPKQIKLLAMHFNNAVAAGGDAENAADTSFFEALRRGDDLLRQLRPLLTKETKSRLRT